jgi:hypothetical protein
MHSGLLRSRDELAPSHCHPKAEDTSFISQMVVANEAALELYLRHAPFDILLFSLKDNLSFRTVPLTSASVREFKFDPEATW